MQGIFQGGLEMKRLILFLSLILTACFLYGFTIGPGASSAVSYYYLSSYEDLYSASLSLNAKDDYLFLYLNKDDTLSGNDVSLDEEITVVGVPGKTVTVPSGYTLTIGGPIYENPDTFSVSGTLTRSYYDVDRRVVTYLGKGEPGSGNVTLTAAMLLGGLIDEDPEGAANWTTDTAANIVAAVGNATIGYSFDCIIYNDASAASAEAVTLKPGTGVVFHGLGHGNDVVLTEATDPIVKVTFRLTNVTAASEAVDAYIFTEL